MDKQKDFENSLEINDKIRTGFIKSYGYIVYVNIAESACTREALERSINHYLIRFKFKVYVRQCFEGVWEICCNDPYSNNGGGWKTMNQFWQIINMTNVCIDLLNCKK